MIVINPYDETKITHGVVTHEACHIADMVFQKRGIIHDLDNDEPYCYLIEGLINEVYKFLDKLNIKLSLEK